MEVVHGFGGVIDLAENIIRAFKDPDLFKADEETGDFYTSDTELPFSCGELMDFNQICDVNWDAKDYVEKYANVRIYAGDQDSFGWLTGVIEPKNKPEWAGEKSVFIVYG